MLYHGNDGIIMFSNGDVLCTSIEEKKSFNGFPKVEELEPVIIEELRLNICESGTSEKSDPNGDYNIAVGFFAW